MYERLIDILNQVQSPKVLLVGDFMLDHYIYGNIDRISPEAPVMILNVKDRQAKPGGAGSVAVDLANLTAEVACLGIVGDDLNGRRLQQLLSQHPLIRVQGLIEVQDRPTTLKQRVIGMAQHRHPQQLMRIDEEESRPIDDQTKNLLQENLTRWLDWCDVVCMEDYNKGLLSEDLCQSIIHQARQQNKPVIVDPASMSDYQRYQGASLVKPNRRELAQASGIPVNGQESWLEACRQLAQRHQFDQVVVTLDKQGAFLYERSSDHGELVPTRQRSVYDVTGAGDMVLAMLGYLIGGKYPEGQQPSLVEVLCLANTAGGLEVERFGCVGISREEILAELAQQRHIKTGKVRNLQSLLQELQWHRQQRLKVVFTNGCFDILHLGHIDLLTFAKQQGDILIVGINSDNSIRRLKGPQRPILNQQDRAALLSAMEAVDYVIIFDEDTPEQLIEKISPEILIKGADWTGQVVGQDWVQSHGGQVVLMPLIEGRSTTRIIEQVLACYSNDSGQKQDEHD